ncbi:Glycosyl transferase, group 1 [Castellaniella defragrans 65Phen]|uniref:Glycosyl transferase, group 1 n=1 Tax=Castellaniella defragrans (strain DSM 12143 / CCUG 39792 / 65Phen) TaxID=1437824 RepID=W8WZF4_CASD6|nr:glycosyltransferase family 1 protein [Castellaniella defragrans]CDM25138.1 Glycosyl transferase, group 1 [Castellaniella defragrans 65Phen]
MQRIAIVSEHASPLAPAGGVDSGGQNIYVANVARQLAARGYRVDVYTRLDSPSQPPVIDWGENVRVIHVPAGPARYLPKEELLPLMGAFGRFLEDCFEVAEEPYDLIHANFFMSAMASMPVARRFGIPLAVTFHALGRVRRRHQARADRFPDSRFAIEEEIVRRADCLIAECPQDRRDLIELYGADPARISMVPCGFDGEEMAPMDRREARRLVGWPDDAFYLLQLGRMVPRKGIDNVIRALARLRFHHHVDARLCVVGGNIARPTDQDVPELLRLREIAREEGVPDRVEFTGRRGRTQLRRYYCAADVFVSTPWYEPFGITPVEAMACATPVVGADTGGIRYSVADGETGFLVPPRDPDRLAEKLAVLARDPELARRMGQAGVRRANRLFTWREVGEELAEVFEVLIRRRPRLSGPRVPLSYDLPLARAAREAAETTKD